MVTQIIRVATATGSPELTCNLAVALGTPGSRTLSAVPPRSHIDVMGTRYWDLVYTLRGLQQTGVPLVAINGEVVGPSSLDDIGSYYVIPKLSILRGLPVARAIDLFYVAVLLFSLLGGAAGFLVLYGARWAAIVALVGLLLLTAIAYRVGDVYLFYFVTAAIAVPWTLVMVRRPEGGLFPPLFLVLMGILIGTANAVRGHAGTATLLFMCGVLVFGISAIKRRKLVLVLCLGAGVLIPRVYFEMVVAQRDAFLHARCPEYTSLATQHPFWHAVYSGFGYLQNGYGIKWDDSTSYERVESVAPGTVYGSPQYERILRHEVLLLAWQHPLFVLMTLASKAGVVLCLLVLSINFGILATVVCPKPWPIELAFWSAIGFNALFGLLVMPSPKYLLGLITFAGLYSIVSINFAIQRGALHRLSNAIRGF
jgi:hypothetical protein